MIPAHSRAKDRLPFQFEGLRRPLGGGRAWAPKPSYVPAFRHFIAIYYAPPLIGGGIKRWCCLTSVAYIGPKSRTERPRTKIGTEVAHVTQDSDTTFKVKRSPGRFTYRCVNGSGSCSGERRNVLAVGNYCHVLLRSAHREERSGGISWRPPSYNFFHFTPRSIFQRFNVVESDGKWNKMRRKVLESRRMR